MRHLLKLFLFCSGVGMLVLGGCGGSSEGELGTEAYLPLTVGNVWRYRFTDYTQEAARKLSLLSPRGLWQRPRGLATAAVSAEDTVRVTRIVSIGGSQWFEVISQYEGGEPSPPIYVRHNAQGLLRRDSLTDPGYYILKNPVAVGTMWTDPFDPQHSFRIVATGQTISVPAGVFSNCAVVEDIIVRSGAPNDVVTSWYAQGAGLVKEERHMGDTLVDELVLLAYELVP